MLRCSGRERINAQHGGGQHIIRACNERLCSLLVLVHESVVVVRRWGEWMIVKTKEGILGA